MRPEDERIKNAAVHIGAGSIRDGKDLEKVKTNDFPGIALLRQ
jgi:hypothetical protein